MTLEERIENLKEQQKGAENLYLKCQGAIEVLEEMINEKNKPSKD
jgi:uncharacterized protein (UPF0147 family)